MRTKKSRRLQLLLLLLVVAVLGVRLVGRARHRVITPDLVPLPTQPASAEPPEEPRAQLQPGPAPGPPLQHGQTYRAERGNFSFWVPSGFDAVSAEVQQVETKVGSVDTTVYRSMSRGEVKLISAWFTDYGVREAQIEPEKALTEGVNRSVASIDGEVLSARRIEYRGHPGREWITQATVGGHTIFLKSRAYMIGDRFYQLAFFAETREGLKSKQGNRFLQSFALEESAVP